MITPPGTSTFLPFLLLSLVTAVVDWVAVDAATRRPGTGRAKPLEYLAKPLTMVFLIVAALLLADGRNLPGLVVAATVAALVLSLVGDIFLMLPEEKFGEKFFVPGLGAFLLAHVAYVVAFVRLRDTAAPHTLALFLVGVVLAATLFATVGRQILAGAKAQDPKLGVPVLAYLTVISLMAATAWWTADLRIVLGALLFCLSDAVIGWTRFIQADRRGPVVLIVTYHLAQMLLVLGLLHR